MKRFVINTLIFATLMILIDWTFGKIISISEAEVKTTNYYCLNVATDKVLVLGSSFAARNIVPQIIEDSLNLGCYNAGEPGAGIVCAYARYKMFVRNNKPDMIIYTLTPSFDYIDNGEDVKYLDKIKSCYGNDESVNKLYNDFGCWSDGVQLKSNLVRYNTNWISIIGRSVSGLNIEYKGYKPLYTTFKPVAKKDVVNEEHENGMQFDSLKYAYLDELFYSVTSNNIPIICLITPQYGHNTIGYEYNMGLELCKKYGIKVYNDIYIDGISQNESYFYDCAHLNDSGARIYTSMVVNYIRDELK